MVALRLIAIGLALLLLPPTAGAEQPGALKSWVQAKPRLRQRLAAALGGARARNAFVNKVGAAVEENRIGGKSGRWLLKFTARGAAAKVDPKRVLEQLEVARALGAKTGVASELRHYAERYFEEGVVRSRADDSAKFATQARALQKQVNRARRTGRAELPPLVIGFDGADGAGKSSSQRRLAWALERLGYEVVDRVPHLLKPPAGQSYLDYFKQQVGTVPGAGQVMFLDRTMLGQIAYGHDPASARQAMNYLKRSLRRQRGQVLIFTAQLPEPRAAQTYGKRLARELFSDDPSLSRVSASDIPAFQRRAEVNRAFADATAAFPANAHLVDVGDRDGARQTMLRRLGRSILASMKPGQPR